MASGPITSWQIDGETAADFILGGSKVTADAETLIPWKKSYDQSRQHIKKLKYINLIFLSKYVMDRFGH